MDIRIGIVDSAREIEVELDEGVDQKEFCTQIETAMAGNDALYWLTDRKGRMVGIPLSRLAYIEVAPDHNLRKVGFTA